MGVRPSSPDRAVERKARTPGGHEDPPGPTGQHSLCWGAGLAQRGVPRLGKLSFELLGSYRCLGFTVLGRLKPRGFAKKKEECFPKQACRRQTETEIQRKRQRGEKGRDRHTESDEDGEGDRDRKGDREREGDRKT